MDKLLKKQVIAILIPLFAMFTNCIYGQYEQKITLQFSSGSTFIVSNNPGEDVFGPGIVLNGGLQYNFTRKISLTGMVVYSTYFATDNVFSGINLTYYNLGLGAGLKYKFNSNKKLTPYLLGGATLCFTKIEFMIMSNTPFTNKQHVIPGIVSGIGCEYKLTDNFTLFAQSGFNMMLPSSNDGAPNTQSVNVIIGTNINIFKSKKL